jgi:hypothetical protein
MLLVAAAGLAILPSTPPAALAADEYIFTHVDDFLTTYDLGECYLYDINDQNVACGMATIQIGPNLSYTGLYWTEEDEKVTAGISWPRGISNPGVMAGVSGVYDIPSGQFNAVPLLPSLYLPLVLLDVNDAGLAVGYEQICNCSNSGGTLQVPYIWDAKNGARSLDVPGANGAAKVNENGLIVGWIGGWSMSNGYVYDLTAEEYFYVSELFEDPNVKTTADDVNDMGVVLGQRLNGNGTIAWAYTWSEEDGVTLLPLPPAGYQTHVRPASLNNGGIVVGSIFLPDASSRAFVYDEANGIRDLNTLTTIDVPGYVMLHATAVNDNGWIVGYGTGGPDGTGLYTSFVLKPAAVLGDLNGDGEVGPADLAILLSAWGPCEDVEDCPADFNGDGEVGPADLAAVLGNWGGL